MLLLEKQCTKCKQMLPSTMFPKHSQRKDGLYSHCRNCNAETHKQTSSRENKRKRERNKEKKQNFNAIVPHSIYFFASCYKPEHIKIGYTSNLFQRTQAFLNATSGSLFLIALLKVDGPDDELLYHRQFDHLRIRHTEWFEAKAPLIKFISSLDQSLAHASIEVLPPTHQSRITIPRIEDWIDSLPFLG